ncbi:hypothetical protein T05_12372 [Trichinella murrelli]|uniref:Uncharacterized protein n=1 Tax=Trichinella murrelli TaxID=144512 RepID=A0A0V0TG53_9BILA|nr:hypothetical protein T05_12372 [Trichinella murrelli]
MPKTKKGIERSNKSENSTKRDETPSPKGKSNAIKEINLETLSREKYCYEMKRCRLLLERLRNENAELQAELKSRLAAKRQENFIVVKSEIEKNSNIDKDKISADCPQTLQMTKLEKESAVEESDNTAELVKALERAILSLIFEKHEYIVRTHRAECLKRMSIVDELKKRTFDENLKNEIIRREEQLQKAVIYYEYVTSFIEVKASEEMSALLNHSPAYYSPTCSAVNPNLINLEKKAKLPKEYVAARPLFKLPYYFGHGTVEQFQSHLEHESSYLLFIDYGDNNQLKLMICDHLNNIFQWPIMQTDSGYFFIKSTDIDKQFLNVDNLMNYHIFQNTKFETFDSSFVTLDNAVYRKSKNLILENSSNYKEWDYFVGENQIEQMDNLLLYSGDFVLAEEKKNNGIILKLFYKWNDHIYSMVFNRECKYFLPRHHNGPEEWVDNLDKLLKSLCMCNFRFNGVQLIHPVNVKKRLNMHMTPPMKHNDDGGNVEIRKPDVPLFDLPYYFGEIRKEYAEQRLKMFSDFLLYTDLQTKKLMVGVVGELRQKEQICHLEIYPNEKHHFCLVNDDQYLQCSTVESLISHYFHNFKRLQGNGIDFDFIYLLVPKYRNSYDLHIRASNINLSNDRCYFGTDFPIESVRKKLKNNGDYLLQTKNSADLITVRWEGKIFDIKPQKDTIGYILPKNKNDQPTERVKSLNEFAKSAVYCKFVFHNIMLYKAVMFK